MTNEPSLYAHSVEFYFFKQKCRKDRRGMPLYHLHPAPSARPSAFSTSTTMRLSDEYERSFSTRPVWQIVLLVI